MRRNLSSTRLKPNWSAAASTHEGLRGSASHRQYRPPALKIGSPRGDTLMPSFAAAYSDEEIAAVSNYVIGHFGGKRDSVTSTDVRAARN